jgi:tRNA 2-thiouridine synthesizing protein A
MATRRLAMNTAKELKVDRSLDCQGMLCPMPIYQASLALKELLNGNVLEVICTDPGSKRDFPAFAKQSGNELIQVHEDGERNLFYLRKGVAP